MKKSFLASCAALLALIAVSFGSPAAKAGDEVSAKNIVGQLAIVGSQVASDVANATSYASNATANATSANFLNSSDITNNLNVTDLNMPGHHGGIDIDVRGIVVQVGITAGQNAGAVANAVAPGVADAKSVAANFGNSSSIANSISANLGHH
jgi:hypothetical protein